MRLCGDTMPTPWQSDDFVFRAYPDACTQHRNAHGDMHR